jgi:hypothetical protein
MKYIKLNGRYHGFPKWNHMLQFSRNEAGRREQLRYAQEFQRMYGPWYTYPTPESGLFEREYNENWYYDVKRRRLYFREESTVTMLLLMRKY